MQIEDGLDDASGSIRELVARIERRIQVLRLVHGREADGGNEDLEILELAAAALLRGVQLHGE